MANSTEQIEALAAEIGENIYIDVAKWHLYLSNAKLHTVVAEQVYPLLSEERVSTEAVTEILKGIPVKLGGGRLEVPLVDLIPANVQENLVTLLKNYPL